MVVVPNNIAFDDFSGSGIRHTWPYCITGSGRHIAHYGIAGILRTEIRVFLGTGWIFGHDGVFEACSLKSHIPVFDSFSKIGAPFFRRSRIEIIYDRFDRLHQFATRIGSRILRFQAPAADIPLFVRFQCLRTVVNLTDGKPTHPGIVQTRHHGIFRKKNHRLVHLHADRSGIGIGGGGTGGIGHGVCHLNVNGERLHTINKTPIAIQSVDLILGAKPRVESTERLYILGKQLGYLYQQPRRVRIIRLHLKRFDNGCKIVVGHRASDRQFLIGNVGKRHHL